MRGVRLVAESQPKRARVWPRPKLGGVCKMEPRSATEAPLLLHTCEERARAPPRLPPSQQAHHGQGSTSTTTGNKHAVVPNLEAGLNLSPVS